MTTRVKRIAVIADLLEFVDLTLSPSSSLRRRARSGHIEHDASGRTASMNFVDPLAGQFGKRGDVLFGREPACLEAAHLA